ncbi:MAG: hypothetical protein CMF22_11400 [Idiomarinaceae bacterium]|nr:hypothetical protein [Idiomarinaceae bacterium]|tara:strand:- start:100889 stop:101302 length:414 start_codon:yes stop_codon:yes gene_type:complete
MIWTTLLGYLKSPKIIATIAAAVFVAAISFYGVNLVKENTQLENRLQTTEQTLANTRLQLEQERDEYKYRFTTYKETIDSYVAQLNDSNQKNAELTKSVNDLKTREGNECLAKPVGDDVLDALFGGKVVNGEKLKND